MRPSAVWPELPVRPYVPVALDVHVRGCSWFVCFIKSVKADYRVRRFALQPGDFDMARVTAPTRAPGAKRNVNRVSSLAHPAGADVFQQCEILLVPLDRHPSIGWDLPNRRALWLNAPGCYAFHAFIFGKHRPHAFICGSMSPEIAHDPGLFRWSVRNGLDHGAGDDERRDNGERYDREASERTHKLYPKLHYT